MKDDFNNKNDDLNIKFDNRKFIEFTKKSPFDDIDPTNSLEDSNTNEIRLEKMNNIGLHILPINTSLCTPFYAKKAAWILPVSDKYASRKDKSGLERNVLSGIHKVNSFFRYEAHKKPIKEHHKKTGDKKLNHESLDDTVPISITKATYVPYEGRKVLLGEESQSHMMIVTFRENEVAVNTYKAIFQKAAEEGITHLQFELSQSSNDKMNITQAYAIAQAIKECKAFSEKQSLECYFACQGKEGDKKFAKLLGQHITGKVQEQPKTISIINSFDNTEEGIGVSDTVDVEYFGSKKGNLKINSKALNKSDLRNFHEAPKYFGSTESEFTLDSENPLLKHEILVSQLPTKKLSQGVSDPEGTISVKEEKLKEEKIKSWSTNKGLVSEIILSKTPENKSKPNKMQEIIQNKSLLDNAEGFDRDLSHPSSQMENFYNNVISPSLPLQEVEQPRPIFPGSNDILSSSMQNFNFNTQIINHNKGLLSNQTSLAQSPTEEKPIVGKYTQKVVTARSDVLEVLENKCIETFKKKYTKIKDFEFVSMDEKDRLTIKFNYDLNSQETPVTLPLSQNMVVKLLKDMNYTFEQVKLAMNPTKEIPFIGN